MKSPAMPSQPTALATTPSPAVGCRELALRGDFPPDPVLNNVLCRPTQRVFIREFVDAT